MLHHIVPIGPPALLITVAAIDGAVLGASDPSGFVPVLVAVERAPTGNASPLPLPYATGIGGTRAGAHKPTLTEETATDRVGEPPVRGGRRGRHAAAGHRPGQRRPHRPGPGRQDEPDAEPRPAGARAARRQRPDRISRQQLRAGLPHAERRAGRRGPEPGNAGD